MSEVAIAIPPHLTVEQFEACVGARLETERYELFHGEVLAVASAREAQTYIKSLIGFRLFSAIEQAGLPCAVSVDSFGVRMPNDTLLIPDVMPRCGARPDPGVTAVDDPMVIVEVLSPTTRSVDSGLKLTAQGPLASLRHYLIVDQFRPAVIHHQPDGAGGFTTRIAGTGPIALDPPGMILDRFLG